MTDPELNELEALAKGATPGPWFFINGHNLAPHLVLHREQPGNATSQPLRVADVHCADHPGFTSSETGFANARLIAAARTAVPALVAEVRRLRGLLGETGR